MLKNNRAKKTLDIPANFDILAPLIERKKEILK